MSQAKAPKNPEVVHLNGRILLRSCQRNTLICFVIDALAIVIVVSLYNSMIINLIGMASILFAILIITGFILMHLLKICFVDGAMNALIIRGNKGQPVNL